MRSQRLTAEWVLCSEFIRDIWCNGILWSGELRRQHAGQHSAEQVAGRGGGPRHTQPLHDTYDFQSCYGLKISSFVVVAADQVLDRRSPSLFGLIILSTPLNLDISSRARVRSALVESKTIQVFCELYWVNSQRKLTSSNWFKILKTGRLELASRN